MGYHKNKIERGIFGELSKIREEFEELQDAKSQNNKVMELVELSDILGAIEEYIKRYNLTLSDLIIMKDATKSAFEDGERPVKSPTVGWKCNRCKSMVDTQTDNQWKCKCTSSPSPWEPVSTI